MSFRVAEKRELCSSVPVPCEILEELPQVYARSIQTRKRTESEAREKTNCEGTPRNAEITHGEPQEGTEGTPGDKLTE